MLEAGMLLDAAVGLLKRYKALLAIIPLALLLALSHCSDKRHTRQRDEARATVARMEMASQQARRAQIALNADNQALNQRIADDAAQHHAESAPRVALAIRDYADGHRMRADGSCSPSRADPAPVPVDPGAPVESTGNDLVAVPQRDLEALSRDALQGAEARAFLIEQINAGLAVVWPEPRSTATAAHNPAQ